MVPPPSRFFGQSWPGTKEQARFSDAAAEKASTKLKAEQAARRQYEERLSTMALELKDAASRCEFLE